MTTATNFAPSPALARLIDLEWSSARWMQAPFVLDQRWIVTDGKMLAWHSATGAKDTAPDRTPRDALLKAMDETDISSCIADNALAERLSHATVRSLFRGDLSECEACDGSMRVHGTLALGGVGIAYAYLGRLISAGAAIGRPCLVQKTKTAFPFTITANRVNICGFVMECVLPEEFGGERVEYDQ